MNRRALAAAAAVLLLAGIVSPAQAQQAAGRWQCRQANQSLNNNAFENWMYEFGLILETNGSFQAQGNYIAQTNGFNIPFVAQGSWEQQQGAIAVKGIQQQQGVGTQQFFLLFDNISERSMSNQYQSGSGKLLTYCER